ncbi:juvenile hormone esterase-like [Plodia interpunctella]|uniref:juvenile hormone esterase-like n=1 Tax=Plodia interpunctella TaxID=58824 RepID=UPI00236765A1|nr:juvenile hormone esterase-like [Plodia interpunctella]
MGPVVEIEQGKLEGIKCSDNTFIFRSIPYAKPPIGPLRFSDPLPPESWEGTRDATKPCNVCFQKVMLSPDNSLIGDEDCLYLNVYTPELLTKCSSLRPVLFYIHGGGFAGGNGTDYEQVNVHGHFVERGIVVVTFNYRVGVLGFLSLDIKGAPGNMGLKDQTLALQWVNKNISKFGGNPNDVTLYGVSAGAASVEYQMVSPMSRGLFQKAIAQSGSSMSPWSHASVVKEMSRKITFIKGKNFTNDLDILHYLKEMSIEDLYKTADEVVKGEKTPGGVFFGFCPCIEKPNGWQAFLEESEYEMLKRGDFAKVPYMTTFNSREGLVTVNFGSNLQKLVTEKNFGEFLKVYFPMDDATAAEYDAKFKKLYLSLNIFPEPDAFAIDFFSDLDFLAGIYLAAKLMSKYNPSVYLLEFAYDGNLGYVKKMFKLQNYKGSCHGDDWGHIVKSFNIFEKTEPSEADKVISERLLTIYTNFIKHGKPTIEINDVITTHWEPVEYSNVKYLVMTEALKMERDPLLERMALFEKLYEKYFAK